LYDRSWSYKATQHDYDVHLSELIKLSTCCPWALESRGSEAAGFNFGIGSRGWFRQSTISYRVLPVRSGKEVEGERQPLAKVQRLSISSASETDRDSRFIAYNNATVLDTRTNLMWAAKDNGSDINWANAKSYCENYRGGGYTDWRMPTQDELAELYDGKKAYRPLQQSFDVHLTELIQISAYCPYASETRGNEAAFFHFLYGTRGYILQPHSGLFRALPVRSGR
jgi:hypothetical protein